MLVLIVISSLLITVGLGKTQEITGKKKYNHDTTTEDSKENEEDGNSSEEKDKRPSLPSSKAISTTKAISRSSSPTNEDYSDTKNSKIHLTVGIPLIIAALILGAAVMVIIFCIIKKCKSQWEHHASKLSDGRLDKNILTSSLQMSDSVYENPDDNKIPSANNELVTFGEKNSFPSPNDYEILSEHGHERSSLEHRYGCVLAGSDVNLDTHNEHSEVINTGVEHDYFVLSLSEADVEKSTGGSEIKMVNANHEYFVLAPDECAFERNKIPSANNELVTFGEKNSFPSPNDYEILSEHGHERSSLEHPYGCVLAGSDVNLDTHNEHSEVINTGVEHDYFVLSLSEADGEKSTGGSEIKMVNANHDYFVLAPDECAFERNKMEMAEKTHDYFVLERHTNDEEILVKKSN